MSCHKGIVVGLLSTYAISAYLLPKFVRLILGSKMVIEEGQTTQRPKEKGPYGQTTIYKTLHRKLKIEQHEP